MSGISLMSGIFCVYECGTPCSVTSMMLSGLVFARGWCGWLARRRVARANGADGFAERRSGAGRVGDVRCQTSLARERVRTLGRRPLRRASGRERLAGDRFGKKMGQTAAWKRIHLQKSDGVAIKVTSYVKWPVQAQFARSQR